MSAAIVMPKVGLTMTEGKIVEWRKSVGDRIELGEVVFVFETEKVSFEVEATQTGQLSRIIVPEGETVTVGAEVAILDGKSGAAPDGKPAKSVAPAEAAAAPVASSPSPTSASGSRQAFGSSKVRATPLARRIAKSNNIDIAEVAAAGAAVPLKRRDVDAFLAAGKGRAQKILSSGPAFDPSEGKLVKLTSMREIIARKMLASTNEAAQAYMVVSVDAGNLVDARKRLIPAIEKQTGVKPSITDLLAKIVAVAIGHHPIMNTRWTDDGIVWVDKINMGIATALDDGLVVPVLNDIGNKKLAEIAVERSDLTTKARAGKLPPENMRGSTFSISSLGMFGVEEFNAIINQPESGILAVGAIIDTPVARDGVVVIRPMMKLTLTYDHRIVDGAKAGGFITTLKDVVEEPLLALA